MAITSVESSSPLPLNQRSNASRRGLSLARREALTGLAFISPWLIGVLLFVAIPFGASFLISLTDYSVLQPGKYVGFANYTRAFNDSLFWMSLRTTFVYASATVIIRVVLGFVLALLLNSNIRGRVFWRTLFYLPSVVPIVAIALIWNYVLHPRFGLLNYLLSLFGAKPIRWLTSPDYAIWGLVIMSTTWVGVTMITFLAGLQNIPRDYYEAASIDGASPAQRLWAITIPLMTPTIFFNVLINMINALQVFVQSLIMTQGGPLDTTRFYMLYLYENAFTYTPSQMGYASALAWILFVIIFILSLVIVRTSNRWVFYGG